MKAAISLTVASSLPVGIVATSQTVHAAYDKTEMRSFVRKTIANYYARGTTVIVKDGHAQQISYGYGYYGRRLGAGNTKVVYPVCSLQKVITAAIITQLIYEGKFNFIFLHFSNLINDVHSVNYLSKNCMTSIKPWCTTLLVMHE